MPGAARLPPLLEHAGERLVRKSELHVTIAESRDQRTADELREAARGLEFQVVPSGKYLFIRKDARRSLIELVTVPCLETFRARLGLALPPAHVTLFTEPGGGGIALHSTKELEALSTTINVALVSPWRLDGDGAILGA
ncbi:MAG: hypothetical protein HY923_09820 [Elusimicrobia bacterium]|nr:hypothetical protein [Elusimicrobiota bacterium]